MNNAYDKYLLVEAYTIGILIGVLLILAAVIIFFGIRYFKERKKNNAIACFVMVAITIACSILSTVYLIPYVADINDQAYIRYEGKFHVSEGEYVVRSGSQPLIQFADQTDSERFKVRGNTYLDDGQHEGYIIYSKRSKIIVEWHCNECADD